MYPSQSLEAKVIKLIDLFVETFMEKGMKWRELIIE